MNERIKELELKAAYNTIDPNRESTPEEMERFKEKFAELIIEACATVGDFAANGGVITPSVMIKEYFGVEE